MRCAGRTRDVLVHQRATEIVAAGLQQLHCARLANLHPRQLHVVDQPAIRNARHSVHQQRLAKRRSAPRVLLQINRRRHVHKRQANELGKPTRHLLQGTGTQHVTRPTLGVLDAAKHDRDIRTQAHFVRRRMTVEPFVSGDLVGAQNGADIVVENLSGGSRQRRQPRLLQPQQVGREVLTQTLGAFGHL